MRVIFAVVALVLVSCSDSETLKVRQFHLRDTEVSNGIEFIRGEMNKRLHGAVTLEEREARKGHYYNISWQGLSGSQPVTVLFEYRQAATGAENKTLKQVMAPSSEGKVELRVAGESYQKGGRVLAWRITLLDGKQSVAQKKSYLWD